MNIIEKEARAGFPRMRGARVSATIPISQDLLDRMLGKLALSVQIQEHNRLFISYGAIRASADIVNITPELTVVLSTSWLYRAALRGVLLWKQGLQTYLAQQGRFVYILCGRIPAVARYRYLWQHLSDIQVRTAAGRLVLNLDARIQ